jgi:hypothetical protein
MKKQIYLLFIILLAGCSQIQSGPTLLPPSAPRKVETVTPIEMEVSSQVIPTKTLMPLSTPASHFDRMKTLLQSYLIPGDDDTSWDILLKNGQWVVYGKNLTPELYKSERDDQRTRIVFTSVDHPDIQNEFIVSGDLDFDYQNRYIESPESRSPDGEGFLMSHFKGKFCYDQNFVVFDENNGQWSGPYYYGQPSNDNNCYGINWSEDGSQLAVYDQYIGGKIHVMIISKQAKLLQQFDIQLPKSNKGDVVNHFYWRGTDFLAWTTDGIGKHNPTRIYAFSSLHPEIVSHLVDLAGDYHIIGKEPGSNRLLITSFWDNCNTLVFNMDKKQIEKQISIGMRCQEDERSSDNHWIAVVNNQGTGFHLLTWDWEALTFQDKGSIKRLNSWQNDLQGFLVEITENYFDVIHP